MTTFDKLCGVAAALLGVILLILGVLGLFFGCQANFTLPPVLGALPALLGWGILRAVYLAWNVPPRQNMRHPSYPKQDDQKNSGPRYRL